MWRSIGAVVAGFLVIGCLSVGMDLAVRAMAPGAFDAAGGTGSVPILLLTQVYVGVFAVFGCWLAGRLAPRNPMKHALILGVLGLIFNVISVTAVWSRTPVWHNVLGLALVMVWAYAGGRLASSRAHRYGAVAQA